jgi:hypothetical protein
MDYLLDGQQAAHRHYEDGVMLLERHRHDNAGYHFGLAAECAIKQALLDAGVVRADHEVIKKLHLPELRHTALQVIAGRGSRELHRVLEASGFFAGWNLRMRYSRSGTVDLKTAAKWRDSANDAIQKLVP